MELFKTRDSSVNLLPRDGQVYYYGKLMQSHTANGFLENLLNETNWQHDIVNIFGKEVVTKRKVAWYGDEPFSYTYSNSTKNALSWTPELLELKEWVEDKTGEKYNSCLLNLYHTGTEGMSWHADDEKELKPNGAIASVSFGAERKFKFRHKKSKETVIIQLEHGSLLVMKGNTQSNWVHKLPPTKIVQTPRINLTFRTIVAQ